MKHRRSYRQWVFLNLREQYNEITFCKRTVHQVDHAIDAGYFQRYVHVWACQAFALMIRPSCRDLSFIRLKIIITRITTDILVSTF